MSARLWLPLLLAGGLAAAVFPAMAASPAPPPGGKAQAAKPAERPQKAAAPKAGETADEVPFFLDLDTGGHRAFVKDLVFSPDGQYVLSASDDKTIRIWDWQSGVSIRTLRGERGPGQAGKIFTLAISPDGKTVAAGGWFGPDSAIKGPYGDVRLFDFRTGKMKAVLKGLQYPVYDLAFSPDGLHLAAGGQDGLVRVWQKSGEDFAAPQDFDADSGHVDRLAFAGNARIAATTTDNGIRLFDLAAGTSVDMPDAGDLTDSAARALAVSADGSRFAIGNDGGAVELFNAADGALISALPKRDYQIGALSFTADASGLIISCGYRCADKNRTEVLSISAGAKLGDYRQHDGTVVASAISPDGKLIATAGGSRHEIHVWDAASFERKALLSGSGAPVTGAGITASGGEIGWGSQNPCPERVACPETMAALDYHLLLPTPERGLERPAPMDGDVSRFRRAVQALSGWTLTASEGGVSDFPNGVLNIARDGNPAASIENDATTGYLHAAFSFLGDAARLVTGGNDGVLNLYQSADGAPAGSLRGGHTGEIHGIAEAPKAGLLLTSSADQTLALWNSETGELIVNLFFAGKDWIIWTPQGYYHSSPDGDNFFGWHVNQGADSEGRFVKARQLKTYLSSPEIIRRAIILKSAEKAVKELRGTDTELQKLLERKPPEFSVKLAEKQPDPAKGVAAVEVTMEADAAASDFAILSNDRRVSAARSASGDGKTMIFEIPLTEGENDIRITGLNEFGYQTERSVKALGNKRSETAKKGNLYVLVIGAERYPNLTKDCSGRPCDLRYPVDDAAGLLRTVKEKSAPLYQSMIPLVLMNREALDEDSAMADAVYAIAGADAVLEPESDNIRDELADFLAKPGPDDTTIIFLAGHGVNIDEDYFFIPSDGRKRSEDRWQRSSLVEWRDIQSAVEDAQGRRVMLIDTCHAGNAFNPRLEKDAVDARIIVFSATDANNTAAEQAELGHGVFTYALLQGLRGAANVFGDGVRLLPLAGYIDKEVRRLTADRQVPRWYWAETDNFILAAP